MRRQWRSFTQWVKATSEAKRRYAEQLVNSKQEEAVSNEKMSIHAASQRAIPACYCQVTQLHRQLQQEKLRYSAGLQENEKLLQNYRNQVEVRGAYWVCWCLCVDAFMNMPLLFPAGDY